MIKSKLNKIGLTLFLAIFFGIIAYFINRNNNFTTQELALIAQENLQKKESLAKDNLDEIANFLKTNKPKELLVKYENKISELYKKEGIGIYVYNNDSLCFWSDNQPSVDLNEYTNDNHAQLIKIRNGWYEHLKLKDSANNNTTIIALIAIKSEYDFENKYLENDFSSWLKLPKNTKIITPIRFLKHAISSKFGTLLFEIYRNDGVYKDLKVNLYVSIITLFCFLFSGLFLLLLSNRLIKNKLYQAVFLIISCYLIRTLMIYYKIPNCFYFNNWFNTTIFANASSFYFSLIGDIFINSFLLFICAIYIYRQKIKINKFNLPVKLFVLIFSSILLGYYSLNITSLIFSLTNNSTITFNINRLFDFNIYSLIGLFSVGFAIFSFYIFLEKLIIFIIENFVNQWKVCFLFLFALIITIVFLVKNNYSLNEYLWPIPLIIISYFLRLFKASNNYINVGLIILIVTFIASNFFYKYENFNKKNTFDALSYTLTDRQDVIAENEFFKITQSLKSDTKLKNLISLLPLSAKQIEQRIKQVNFSGYFERYDVISSLFKSGKPIFQNSESKYLDAQYFENQIIEGSNQTICDNLFFIDKKNNPIRYIGKVDIIDDNLNKDSAYYLYFQLDPKISNGVGVFPDLLLDKSLQSKVESKNISYAVYETNKLQVSHGDFQYPTYLDSKNILENDLEYQHFIYPKLNNIIIIISDVKTGLWELFTSNSYLFIFFSLIVICSVWVNSNVIKNNFGFNSLNNRIQFILISIIVISLAGVALGTTWVVTSQFETKNKKELILKSKSVLNELQQSVGQQNELDPSYKEYTTFTLKKLSQLFSSDISLFDKNGFLFATSQPAIYDQGLVSKFMNPIAYSDFLKNKTFNFSQRENIGNLKYLSTYTPFYNKNDKLLGYLNLPYFSRQKDLEKELSAYLTTLLNIYTILFVITTLIALFVSNLLTKPLRIIKQQISNTKFGKNINPIIWKSKDEIGNLVSEYNAMLIKLDKSSKLLAQSERESAWLEMSKQVAHEIKNPLTPMKLNIQHLQRVVKSNPENISEKVDKVAEMLIQQIDTLSNIATEFSDFAKFPNTKLERVNLVDILNNVTNLFKESSKCTIEFTTEEYLFVLIDKEQCIRALTNLIKNAEQSIPENKIGKINVEAAKTLNSIEIKISDNGSGIPIEYYSRIFTPNFTTKNSGTGLGLAMVKNSINAFNGSIKFESELGIGTTFTITLPMVD